MSDPRPRNPPQSVNAVQRQLHAVQLQNLRMRADLERQRAKNTRTSEYIAKIDAQQKQLDAEVAHLNRQRAERDRDKAELFVLRKLRDCYKTECDNFDKIKRELAKQEAEVDAEERNFQSQLPELMAGQRRIVAGFVPSEQEVRLAAVEKYELQEAEIQAALKERKELDRKIEKETDERVVHTLKMIDNRLPFPLWDAQKECERKLQLKKHCLQILATEKLTVDEVLEMSDTTARFLLARCELRNIDDCCRQHVQQLQDELRRAHEVKVKAANATAAAAAAVEAEVARSQGGAAAGAQENNAAVATTSSTSAEGGGVTQKPGPSGVVTKPTALSATQQARSAQEENTPSTSNSADAVYLEMVEDMDLSLPNSPQSQSPPRRQRGQAPPSSPSQPVQHPEEEVSTGFGTPVLSVDAGDDNASKASSSSGFVGSGSAGSGAMGNVNIGHAAAVMSGASSSVAGSSLGSRSISGGAGGSVDSSNIDAAIFRVPTNPPPIARHSTAPPANTNNPSSSSQSTNEWTFRGITVDMQRRQQLMQLQQEQQQAYDTVSNYGEEEEERPMSASSVRSLTESVIIEDNDVDDYQYRPESACSSIVDNDDVQ